MITNEEYTKAVNKLIDENGLFYLFQVVTCCGPGKDYIELTGNLIKVSVFSDNVEFITFSDSNASLTTEEYLAIGTLQRWIKERNNGQQSA